MMPEFEGNPPKFPTYPGARESRIMVVELKVPGSVLPSQMVLLDQSGRMTRLKPGILKSLVVKTGVFIHNMGHRMDEIEGGTDNDLQELLDQTHETLMTLGND